MQDPNNLQVYKDAYQFGLDVYKLKYPADEKFGIQQQIRRAAVSIALNISEGCGRQSDKDFLRFLYMSFGSLKEVETLLDMSKDLNHITITDYNAFKERLTKLGKKLNKFIQTLSK